MDRPSSRYSKVMTVCGMMALPVIWVSGFVGSELRYRADREATEKARAVPPAVRTIPPVRHCEVGQGGCEIDAKGNFGCRDHDMLNELWGILSRGDKPTFYRVLFQEAGAGRCRQWEQGDRVFKQEDRATASCLRRAGENVCFWTPNSAVED